MDRSILRITLGTLLAAGIAWGTAGVASDSRADDAAAEQAGGDAPDKELFTGKVVLAREALKRRGITAFEELKDQVVLETPEGELIPIIPDWRGRAFFQDPRLRDREVELVGYRRAGVPYLQVLMIFTFSKQGERQYTDYWCDICAIPMYEIKPCDCCQADIRLRSQPQELPAYLNVEKPDSKPAPGTASN